MGVAYDQYLAQHKANVFQGFRWLKDNLPEIVFPLGEKYVDYEWQIGMAHDTSKDDETEYHAYDAYFYGGNRSYAVQQAFNKAWLLHIHRNPHHWQYWILVNDDPGQDGAILIDMDHNYIIEMICDWWAFSWASGNLFEIFKWYDEHKQWIKFSVKTRAEVENILFQMEKKLGETE
jgi:hypothetical protein